MKRTRLVARACSECRASIHRPTCSRAPKRQPLRRYAPIARESAKRKAANRRRRDVVAERRHTHPYCELKRAGAPGRCFGALHGHEPWSRAQGGPIDDPRNLTMACSVHNEGVQQDLEVRAWALDHGYLIPPPEGPRWLAAGGVLAQGWPAPTGAPAPERAAG